MRIAPGQAPASRSRLGSPVGALACALAWVALMGGPIAATRLPAVWQGWDATPNSIRARARQDLETGARGDLIAKSRIDQAWKPKAFQPQPVNGGVR